MFWPTPQCPHASAKPIPRPARWTHCYTGQCGDTYAALLASYVGNLTLSRELCRSTRYQLSYRGRSLPKKERARRGPVIVTDLLLTRQFTPINHVFGTNVRAQQNLAYLERLGTTASQVPPRCSIKTDVCG